MTTPDERILTIWQVMDRVNVSRSSIHRLVKSGLFPRPFVVTGNRIGWAESEVTAWIEERKDAR